MSATLQAAHTPDWFVPACKSDRSPRLQSRALNGDDRRVIHAIPKRYATSGSMGPSLCRCRPGPHTAGWMIASEDEPITCRRCLASLAILRKIGPKLRDNRTVELKGGPR
jgi:hypothetical protein